MTSPSVPRRKCQLVAPSDIPPKPPRLKEPVRSKFASDEEFEAAQAKYRSDKEQAKERRRMMERMRDQQRDRSGRARPADNSERAIAHRQQHPELLEQHRQREAQRYAATQLPPSEKDVAAADFALRHSGQTPGWGRVTKQATAIAASRLEQLRLAAMMESLDADVGTAVEDLIRTVERMQVFDDPDVRSYIEEKRLLRDFAWFSEGAGVDMRRELCVTFSEEWWLRRLDEGDWRDAFERDRYELLTYICWCVPPCHLGSVQPRGGEWPSWDAGGVPTRCATWARWAGCDMPGPKEIAPCMSSLEDGICVYDEWEMPLTGCVVSSARCWGPHWMDAPGLGFITSTPRHLAERNGRRGFWPHREHRWPSWWWTAGRIDEHCSQQAARWLSMYPASWRTINGLVCDHDALVWQCDECRAEMLSDAIELRFAGEQAGLAWRQQREAERCEYDDWRACRDVLYSLVFKLEQAEQRALEKAERAQQAAQRAAHAAAERAVKAERAAKRAREEAAFKKARRQSVRERQKQRDRELAAEAARDRAATEARILAGMLARDPDDPVRVRFEARRAAQAARLAEKVAVTAPTAAPVEDDDECSDGESAALASASQHEELARRHAQSADPFHLAMLREEAGLMP